MKKNIYKTSYGGNQGECQLPDGNLEYRGGQQS